MDIEEIHQQAEAMYTSLQKLIAAERKQKPSAHFGERFNQILEQAKAAINDHASENWPPALEVTKPGHMGPEITYATYVEIEVYAKQVAARLSKHIEPAGIIMG